MRAISLRLDGEASELEAAALERHLAVCPRCRELSAETAALTSLIRRAPLVELERRVVVTSSRAGRRKVVRRATVGVLVAATLAGAGLGIATRTEQEPVHPSSALKFRDLHEQRRYVRAELLRLEPDKARAAQAAPRLAGHGLL